MAVDGTSSSLLRAGVYKRAKHVLVDVVGVSEFFEWLQEDRVDLMKINVEGAEYELIEAMAQHNLLTRIECLQIQFHDFVATPIKQWRRACRLLGATHRPEYRYPFVWEQWRRLD